MRHVLSIGFLMAATLAAPSADAAVLLAQGALNGSSAGLNTDLSGLKGTLENGLPAAVLGGIGSGLAYAGGSTFVSVPDRGPNATSWNSNVDDTVSYISRVQTLDMALSANAPGSALPFSVTPSLTKTTLLYSATPLSYGAANPALGLPSGAPAENTAGKYYFTGRSDNFGAGNSGAATDARFDPESIRVAKDGKSVFISDEYGPYVRQFNRDTGELMRTYTLPTGLDIANKSAQGATEISGNTSGRTANKGMEGLALTPDGTKLVGILQAATIDDAAKAATKKIVRIVTIDVATGKTEEFAYKLTTGSGVSDIVAINDHQFLVDERDGAGLGDGSSAAVKQFFTIDIAGAKDVTGLSGADVSSKVVTKSAVATVDLVKLLEAAGLTDKQIPAKIEGSAFGDDVTYNGQVLHTLYIANDNDFVPGVAGPNQFFVVGLNDTELANYVGQQFSPTPEPASWALMLMGFGGVGALIRRRKAQPVAV